MPITGSQAALMQARSAIARAGATRANYACANPHIVINGTNRTTKVELSSLHVVLSKNDQPSTASFTLTPSAGFTPATSQIVYIGQGSADNYIFGGQIDRLTFRYERGQTNPWIDVECIDFARMLDRRLVTKKYSSQSATDIAADILATYTSGFSGYAIAAGLDTVPEMSFTNESVRGSLLRLATFVGGGGVFPDARRVVHLFGPSGDLSAWAGTNPLQITSSRSSLKEFTYSTDASQIRTKTYVEATSTSLLVDVPAVSSLTIPIEDGAGLQGLLDGDQVRVGSEIADMVHIEGVTNDGLGGDDFFALTPFDTSLREASDSTAIVATDFAVTGSGFYTLNVTAPIGTWFFDGTGQPRITFWAKIGEQIVAFNSFTIAVTAPPQAVIAISGIPATGFGSLRGDVFANDTIKVLDALLIVDAVNGGVAHISLRADHRAGDEVIARVHDLDSAAASALAAIEGGDGIHEHLISDGRLSIDTAREVAAADTDAFATAIGSCSWETEDYNAMPGRSQSVSMTAFTGSLTIAQVEIAWPPDDYSNASTLAKVNAMAKPRRRCAAGTLATSTLDAIASKAA